MGYYLFALIVLLLDQGSKWIIVTTMKLHEQISVIRNFFMVTHYRNSGAAFSILQNQRWFFIGITTIVLIGVIWYMQQMKHHVGVKLPLGLSLILGGATGNFVDRLLTGEVVDFLRFNFGSYTFPIFNIADVAICSGVGLILLDTLLTVKKSSSLT